MLSLLVTLLVLILIFGLASYAIDLIPANSKLKNLAKIVLIFIAILVLLKSLGLLGAPLLL